MNRALPNKVIDVIRDGVPARDLKARGNRAVWHALVSTAASAHQRGWGQVEWEALVLETRSALGRQVRLKDGHRERTARAVNGTLASAWDAAVVWVSEREPAWDGDDTAEVAAQRADAAMALVADADAGLTDAERAVLAYAAREHTRRGFLQVALPRATVVAETELGERTVRTALAGLSHRGLLTVAVPGRAARTEGKRRATLYALADAEALTHYLSRGTRPMGPPDQTYGTPGEPVTGTPDQTYGTPGPTTTTGDPTMSDTLTLTLSEAERAAVLQTLTAMRAIAPAPPHVVESVPPNGATGVGNVVPLRRADGGAR